MIDEGVFFSKMLTCKEIARLRNLGTVLLKMKFKWGNEMRKMELRLEVEKREFVCRMDR